MEILRSVHLMWVFATMAWHVLGLQIEDMASTYGG